MHGRGDGGIKENEVDLLLSGILGGGAFGFNYISGSYSVASSCCSTPDSGRYNNHCTGDIPCRSSIHGGFCDGGGVISGNIGPGESCARARAALGR